MSKVCKIRNNVLELCEERPLVKNDYMVLMVEYWRKYDCVTKLEDVPIAATSAQSIIRAFRKLVEIGKIVVPEYIQRARRKKQKEYESLYSPLNNSVPMRRQPVILKSGGVIHASNTQY